MAVYQQKERYDCDLSHNASLAREGDVTRFFQHLCKSPYFLLRIFSSHFFSLHPFPVLHRSRLSLLNPH